MFDSHGCLSLWNSLSDGLSLDKNAGIPAGGIPAGIFAEGCSYVVSLLRELNVGIAATDVASRVHALEAHIIAFPTTTASPSRGGGVVTVQQLLIYESTSPTRSSPSPSPKMSVKICIHHLLLTLNFVEKWCRELEKTDSLPKAVRLSYDETLSSRHPFHLRLAVHALSHLLPSKKSLLQKLEGPSLPPHSFNSSSSRASVLSIEDRLAGFAVSVNRVRLVLEAFTIEKGLNIE